MTLLIARASHSAHVFNRIVLIFHHIHDLIFASAHRRSTHFSLQCHINVKIAPAPHQTAHRTESGYLFVQNSFPCGQVEIFNAFEMSIGTYDHCCFALRYVVFMAVDKMHRYGCAQFQFTLSQEVHFVCLSVVITLLYAVTETLYSAISCACHAMKIRISHQFLLSIQ